MNLDVIITPKKGVFHPCNVYFYHDEEFDGLRGDAFSVTGVPDTNLPNKWSHVDP